VISIESNYLSVSIYWYSDPPSIDLEDYKPETLKPYESRPTDRVTDRPRDKKTKNKEG
jgi:hypothetical protein